MLVASAMALIAFGVFAVIASKRGHRVHGVMAVLILCVLTLGAFTANDRADAAACNESNVPVPTTTVPPTTTIPATTTTTTPEPPLTVHFTISCDTTSSPNQLTCTDFYLSHPSGYIDGGGFTGTTATGDVAPGTVINISGSFDLVLVDDGGASCVDNSDATFDCTINSDTDIIAAKPMPILNMTALCTGPTGYFCNEPVITGLTDSSTDGTPGMGTVFNNTTAGGQVYPGDQFTITGNFDTVIDSGVATCDAVSVGSPSTVVCTAGIESGGILNDIELGTVQQT
ncbi:MAG: hypothetical protein F2789_13330 [Actinobacteria bacterium]|nr:hypothetical protein [Actinomycetota bacterium]